MFKIKTKIKYLLSAFFLIVPYLVWATGQINSLKELIERFVEIIELIIPILVGFAFLAFIWGLVNFIKNSGNEQNRKTGKQLMVWGIIGIFAMVSVWGIVELLHNTFF